MARAFLCMRYSYDQLSPQGALIEQCLEDIDTVIKEDFILTPVDELAPLGIDRILFLQFIQISAFYVIEPESSVDDHFRIKLTRKGQMLWPYQSLAQWLVLASIPRKSITIFNLIDIKMRLTNWKIKSEGKDTINLPWADLDLFKLRSYPWEIKPHIIKKFAALSWNLD